MLEFVNTRPVRLCCCAALLAALGACTINIVPPGSPPPPSAPAPNSAPPSATTVVPPAVIEQRASVQGTHDCQELQRAGMNFTQVVQHWYVLGAPSDMDDDSDGIPCETVYGER